MEPFLAQKMMTVIVCMFLSTHCLLNFDLIIVRIPHLRIPHWGAILRWGILSPSVIRITHPNYNDFYALFVHDMGPGWVLWTRTVCSITIFRRKKQLKNIVFDFLTISPYLYKTANRWRISPRHDCSSQFFLIQHFHIMVIVIVIIVIITLLLIIISSSIAGHLHIYSKTGNLPSKCNFCDFTSTRTGHLRTVKKNPKKVTCASAPHKCYLCKYSASLEGNLKRYMKNEDMPPVIFLTFWTYHKLPW